MRLLIFSRYDFSQAATRVRFLQYVPYMKVAGIDVEIFPILDINGLAGKAKWLTFVISRIKSFFKVSRRLFKEKRKTLILIHFELFPFIPFFIEYGLLYFLGHKKYIIELDDAWFHRYDANKLRFIRIILGRKIDLLMKHSILVIAGNEYIGTRAKQAGAKNIEIIPTVVDVEKYQSFMINSQKSSISLYGNKPIVGWIGSPATTKFLLTISDTILKMDEIGAANFVAIGADYEQLNGLPIKVIEWNDQIELEILYNFDIGIMPLTDSLFEKGKCGYKLIQYMACGLPVVASPVGANKSIVIHESTGYLASSNDEWYQYLMLLCKQPELRKKLGDEGLHRAENLFSLKVTSEKYVSIIKASF